jgi:hypothetical protein
MHQHPHDSKLGRSDEGGMYEIRPGGRVDQI